MPAAIGLALEWHYLKEAVLQAASGTKKGEGSQVDLLATVEPSHDERRAYPFRVSECPRRS